jgi:hypothetical protein
MRFICSKPKIYAIDHNSVLADVLKEFEVVDRVEKADRVVVWGDTTSLERGVVNYAKSLGKPTIVVQHGRRGTSRYYPPFSEPIMADKLCVWGERDKKSLVKVGHQAKKIFVTGTTIFQHLKEREKHGGINIVFCPEHWDRELSENKDVAQELRKLRKEYNIVTKIIEGHDPKLYDNPVFSNRNEPDHLEICAKVLSTADLVVGISESTFELMAQYLDIPVVVVEDWFPKTFGGDERYYNYRRVISEASKRTNLKDLIVTIKQQLARPQELREQRKTVVIEEGGTNITNPLKEICRVISLK